MEQNTGRQSEHSTMIAFLVHGTSFRSKDNAEHTATHARTDDSIPCPSARVKNKFPGTTTQRRLSINQRQSQTTRKKQKNRPAIVLWETVLIAAPVQLQSGCNTPG
jgi:hypothetical protein